MLGFSCSSEAMVFAAGREASEGLLSAFRKPSFHRAATTGLFHCDISSLALRWYLKAAQTRVCLPSTTARLCSVMVPFREGASLLLHKVWRSAPPFGLIFGSMEEEEEVQLDQCCGASVFPLSLTSLLLVVQVYYVNGTV